MGTEAQNSKLVRLQCCVCEQEWLVDSIPTGVVALSCTWCGVSQPVSGPKSAVEAFAELRDKYGHQFDRWNDDSPYENVEDWSENPPTFVDLTTNENGRLAPAPWSGLNSDPMRAEAEASAALTEHFESRRVSPDKIDKLIEIIRTT